MKKIAIGIFVLGTFIVYSFHQRNDGSAAVVAPRAAAMQSNQTQTSPTLSHANMRGSSTAPTMYKDGQYIGSVANAYYGYVQVEATVQGGKLTDVQFLQYPNDQRNSVEINSQAIPYLKQEAIKAQSSRVNTISGATDTSQAFIESLTSALRNA